MPTQRHPATRSRPVAIALLLAAITGASLVAAGCDETAANDALPVIPITSEQVTAGADAYAQHCASCHGAALEGVAHFPPVAGAEFRQRWSESTVGELHAYVRDLMPVGAGGSLEADAYAAIVAYMLERNGVPVGETPFDPEDEHTLALPLPFGD